MLHVEVDSKTNREWPLVAGSILRRGGPGTAPGVAGPRQDRGRITVRLPAWSEGPKVALVALERAYLAVLSAAGGAGAKTLAVEPLGVGTEGYPSHPAAYVAVRVVRDHAARVGLRRVVFLCPDATTATVFRDALAANALVRRPAKA
jgi:O-acetyl-ADP-ribose deacetylase (regulator of RNase III)